MRVLLPVLLACAADDDRRGPATLPTPGGEDTAAPVDSDPSVEAGPPVFLDGPRFGVNPDPRAPLVQILEARTDVPCRLDVVLTAVDHAVTLPFATLREVHEVDILGLYADRAYEAVVKATAASGQSVTSGPAMVVTAPLPDRFPAFAVRVAEPDAMEPGVTLFQMRMQGQPPNGTLIGVDAQGEVVWFFEDEPTEFREIHRAEAGQLVVSNVIEQADFVAHHLRVLSPRGDTLARWTPEAFAHLWPDAVPVAVPTFHHDVQEGPGDNRFVLTVERREVADYPTSETDPDAPTETATVAVDVIIELAPDGTVVDRWAIDAFLDPIRIGYDAVESPFWSRLYGPDTRDWAHTNAVLYDAATDAFVVSARNQDAVFRVGRSTRELSWVLAPRVNWRPAWHPWLLRPVGDDFRWSHHQHAPMLTEAGTLLLFDNGNHRASAYEPKLPDSDNRSRAVEYAIDPAAMTVEQVWQYAGGDERMFCPAMGDADVLPETGNALLVYGWIRAGDTPYTARILEVTRTDPAEVVFDLVMHEGNTLYRAERIPSLYPDPG